jgi:hypothetical protein
MENWKYNSRKMLKGNSEANYTHVWHEEGVGRMPSAAAAARTTVSATITVAAATTKYM